MGEQLSMSEMPDHASYANQEDLRRQPHLEIYENYFVLTGLDNVIERIWSQGKQSQEAQARYKKVQIALRTGFFDQKIEEARSPDAASIVESALSIDQRKALEEILSSVTDQAGRALVDIFILQLVIKAMLSPIVKTKIDQL